MFVTHFVTSQSLTISLFLLFLSQSNKKIETLVELIYLIVLHICLRIYRVFQKSCDFVTFLQVINYQTLKSEN